jgi:hypothetical protein
MADGPCQKDGWADAVGSTPALEGEPVSALSLPWSEVPPLHSSQRLTSRIATPLYPTMRGRF